MKRCPPSSPPEHQVSPPSAISSLFLFTFTLLLLTPTSSRPCGLDWTLPHAHFDAVDEQGHLAYWQKIAQADLGDGLSIPLYLGFNSRRQTSSPSFGKGWILPLLESHVEPLDENSLRVLMPDGWSFSFLRNANSDTWRGNAGWIGQTHDTQFTITAPCGWRLRFDSGHIQEIDTPKNRAITIKYNGSAPVEADLDNQPFLQVESNPATGLAQDILIGHQKIDLQIAQRPRIQTVHNQTLITGFDPALSQLHYPDGTTETFSYAPARDLAPALLITPPNQPPRLFTWDPVTFQIKTDGDWTYHLTPAANVTLIRANPQGQTESYFNDPSTGTTVVQGLDGVKLITKTYVNAGLLTGRIRKIMQLANGEGKGSDNAPKTIYSAAYDENGVLIREQLADGTTRLYNPAGVLTSIVYGSKKIFLRQFDAQQRVVFQQDTIRDIIVTSRYLNADEHIDSIFHHQILLYTRDVKAGRIVNLQE